MIRSKAHWGFDDDFMSQFAGVISMSPASVANADVWILEEFGSIIGFYALVPQGDECVLDDLWLLPEHIGGGLGRVMFEHAAQRARELGAAVMKWEAEPFAVGFYTHMGGRVVGEKVSELGRTTPIMAYELTSPLRTSDIGV
jgi:GNAT superfamily N-acetyltransferase